MEMKGTKIIASIFMIVTILCIVFGQSISYAADSALYVGISEMKELGFAYAIGNPSQGGKNIWDLVSYTNDSGSARTNPQKDLYCVKAGVGFTNPSSIVTYTQNYDLRTQRSAIQALSTRSTNYSDVAGTYYREILCILDNLYIPGKTDKEALLKDAGIDLQGPDYTSFPVTDDDIETVQQMAIWYYTNHDDSSYHKDNINLMNIKNNTASGYEVLADYHKFTDQEGEHKYNQMEALYEYLISFAETNKSRYDSVTVLGDPVTITNTTISATSLDSNYNKVGPISITKNNNLPYTLDFEVKKDGTTIIDPSNYSFINNSGVPVDKDKATGDIYLKIPKTFGENLYIDINLNYNIVNATLWIPETSNVDQPIIEVDRVPKEVPFHLNPDTPQPFDLALRKFITRVGETDVTNRIPQLRGWTLDNGTTIKKEHTKDPYKVKVGDEVEFTIRVYNEGEQAGYAEEVTDYILNNVGLEYLPNHATNIAYNWQTFTEGSKEYVKTDYLSKAAGEAAGRNNLIAACEQGSTNPDYRDLKIVFKVKTTLGQEDNKIVNIAAITDDADSDGNEVTDRDSVPGKEDTGSRPYPNPNYKTEDHEDDIDYEEVELKAFDLSLRKFITAVSSDTTIDPEDYLTGNDSREPVIPGASEQQWRTDNPTTLIKNHRKDALTVKSGDYVLYTIRVYNEGEVDGYASLIKDSIPEGLELTNELINHPINAKYLWDVSGYSNRYITTDYLAKGKGEEDGWSEGDAKYTANLLKALTKNDDGSVNVRTTDPKNPDYRDVQVLLKVTEPDTSERVLENRAQISDDSDAYGNEVTDRDSTPDVWEEAPRDDDQDIERIKLEREIKDLALRKHITQVDETTFDSRNPSVDTTALETGTTAKYNHTKEPVEVSKGSVITYALTAYNEGTVDAYASEITDFLPEGLEFIPSLQSSINSSNGWKMYKRLADGTLVETTDPAEARVIKTDALKNQKIAKRDENPGSTDNPYTLHCYSVQVQLKVKDTVAVAEAQTNIAEITEYRFNGNADTDIAVYDIDSKSNSLTDGDSSTGTLPSDADLPNYNGGNDPDKSDNYIPGQQDDDDFEKVIVKPKVDLALTKFITAVSPDETIEDGEYITPDQKEGSKTNPYLRAPAVNTNPLKLGGHDAIYTLVKSPLTVADNSYVLYNIRVYNEGEVNVYVGEVKDYLPEGLEFVDNQFNRNYGWTATGQEVKTNYLAYGETSRMLKAFDAEHDDGAGSGLDYKDLPILCKVSNTVQAGVKLVNSAEITQYQDENGSTLERDIDSAPANLDNSKKNKEGNPEGRYDEDDEDYDVVLIKKIDLALTKFITAVSPDEKIEDGEYLTADTTSKDAGTPSNPYTRQTKVDTNPLKQGGHDAIYTQVKDPLTINRGSYVLYNIRVYNEGQVDLFAGEVTDYLPENLEFIDGDFNKKYGWTANGQEVKTRYLSYEENSKRAQGEPDRMLKAFDSAGDDGAGSGLDYKDLPILCRVYEKTPSAKNLINTAEITEYQDEYGKKLIKDIDSTPNNKNPKNVPERSEDDDDFEIVVVEEFDLSLIKYVCTVIVTEDGKTTTTETHNTGNNDTDIVPKVEIHRKKINSTIVKFVYTIRITNEGDIEGYAKEITDYVPEGLAFYAEDNQNWTVKSDGVIATRQLENTLLKPGESADVQVTFRWINGANNLGLKRNTAEISEDYNKKRIPDRDSTPNNKKPGEDDIDIADVLLSIKTGAARTYILLTGAVLVVFAGGVFLIKKYVM